jgi:hypothetical protein
MKLKKLEWQKNIDGLWYASALHGAYVIGEYDDNCLLTFGINNGAKPLGEHATLDKTMDAAQLDFERIVCDCYECPETAEAQHE